MSGNSWVIWDKEVDDLFKEGNDQLWTKKYVDQLFNIITNLSDKELEKGFNIWLYWWWWSGKSSIARTLIDKLNGVNNFTTIYFDCRKYSSDDLRRSILFKIGSLYNNPKILEELNNSIYRDKQNTNKKSGINIDEIKKIWKFFVEKWSRKKFIQLLIVLTSFILLCGLVFPNYSLIEVIFWWTIVTAICSIIHWIWNIVDYVKDLIPKIDITHNIIERRIFSWEQFEEVFRILIWESVKTTQFIGINDIVKDSKIFKDKKILFVFDNIDRCESGTVKEILMTIKTFLNQNNCVFLLPIDYESVCESYEEYDQWDEYLRKIFNLWITLKQPHYNKFSDLVMKLMETNLRKDEKWLNITDDEANIIAYILASAFADNPRKIKQFLNQLWAEYILYKKEKSILSILKELIIRLEFPELFNSLLEEQNILFANEKLNDHINSEIIMKNKYTEKQQILLKKIWWIKEEIELLDDDNIKLEKAYHSPKDFLELIKKDNLQGEACKFLRSNIETARIWWKMYQIDLLENSIFYMSEYKVDKILFDNIFWEWSEFCSSDVMNVISSIDSKILYKFLGTIWEKWIKKLPNNFKITFTERFFTEEPIDNDITEFEKLDENTQNLVISNDAIINYFKKYFKDNEDERNLSEWNYFRFLQKFPKFVNDNFIKNVLKEVDLNSFNFWKVKSINIINLVSLWQHFTEESLEIIYQLEELFFNGYQSLINDYLWNSTNAVNSYLSCSAIIIKYWKGDWKHTKVMTNLVNLYNKYWINEFRDKVMEIFEIDFNRFLAYQWAYADIIINMNDNNKIKKLIEKTHDEWDKRRWLNNNQVENIIDNISREDDTWNNIIQSIRKNESTKNILFNRINWINDDTEKISKIKQLDTLGILTEKDKELFWNELTSKLKTRLESWSIEDMEKVCDFIEDYHNSNIIKYIDYNCVYESLKSFDINIFKPQYKADEFDCYKGKKTKALRYLTNIKKKFGSFNWKNKK